jgi:2-dehydro-3-deoxygluconokinase
MNKVFCFGELLLRLSPAAGGQWIRDASMPVYIGGAELNVATALSKWKLPVRYCTALPDNSITSEIVEELQGREISTSAILFSGNRIGIYYLPQGSDLKHPAVIYDREYSSFAGLKPGMIDWNHVLDECSWFHFSAITPALNATLAAVCVEALEVAASKSIPISVDLNYRSKLWQYGTKPAEIMPSLVRYCNVIMGNTWAAESLLGIESALKESKGASKEQMIDAAGQSMKKIHEFFGKVETMAFTYRLDNSYFAVLQHGPELKVSSEFLLGSVADRVGSGDCFMAGLIYGLYHNHPPQEIVDYAVAAAVGKLKEQGDSTSQTIESVKNILSTNEQQ